MKFYLEAFNKPDESFSHYLKTDITVESFLSVYNDHPVYCYDVTPEIAQQFNLSLDFEQFDWEISGTREYEGETYEYNGEILYPPPVFLPDSFNSTPEKAK